MAITLKECKYCGKEFYGTKKAVFCSSNCRVYNHNKKKKEAKLNGESG